MVSIGLIIGFASVGTDALAQSANSDDEIVVTARSRAESLMSTPVAATVLGQQDLNRYSSDSLVKISQQTPMLTIWTGGEGNGGSFIIRGIGTTGVDSGLEQSVALNLDGIQTGRPRMLFDGLYDVAQVEILKGPQALFFGKNSPAGVIAVRTADPSDDFEARLKTGYEFNARESIGEAAVGGPVTDYFSVRLAGIYSHMRGYVQNIATARPDPQNPSVILPGAASRWGPASEKYGLRLTLLFKPTSNFTSNLKLAIGHYKDNGPESSVEPVCAAGIVSPVTGGLSDPQSDCRLNGVKASTAIPALYVAPATGNPHWLGGIPFTRIRTEMAVWTNTFEFSQLTLRSVSGYSLLKRAGGDNSNATVFAQNSGGVPENYRAYSQELRLSSDFAGPLNFAIGGYFENTRNQQNGTLYLGYLGQDPATQSYQSSAESALIHGKTYSLFGQIQYKILPTLELAGGVRWTKVKKDGTQSNTYAHPTLVALGRLSPSTSIIANAIDEDNTSPEVTLTWRPSGETMLYAAYKTGYKSGGISAPPVLTPANTAEALKFGAETVRGFEGGYRGQLLNRRLRVTVTAYHYKYRGLQLSSFDAATVSYRLQNAADSTQNGIEGDLNLRVTDPLTLRAAAGYNHLEYVSFKNAQCYAFQTAAQGCVGGVQDLSGRRVDHAPEFSGSMGVTYERAVTADLTLGVGFDAIYTSSSFNTATQNPTSLQKGYWMENASLRLSSTTKQWELALIGRNLGNKRIMTYVADRPAGAAGDIKVSGSRPREILLQLSTKF